MRHIRQANRIQEGLPQKWPLLDYRPKTDAVPELFDLIEDPHETNNLATRHPEIVHRLSGELDRWWSVVERKVLGAN